MMQMQGNPQVAAFVTLSGRKVVRVFERSWSSACACHNRQVRNVLSIGTLLLSALVVNEELIKAIELALAGQWDDAHGIVQQYESDSTAAWIHAVLHKIEGDSGNSRYWYRHAGKLEHFPDEPRAELAMIREGLMGPAS